MLFFTDGVIVRDNSRYVTFQLAEVSVTQNLFAAILDGIARLGIPQPHVAGHPG